MTTCRPETLRQTVQDDRVRVVVLAVLCLSAGVMTFLVDRGDSGAPPIPEEMPSRPSHDEPRREVAFVDSESGTLVDTGIDRQAVEPLQQDDAPPAASDEEWDSYPITTFSFPRTLVRATAHLDATWLFRNRGLNPQDTYLEPATRQELSHAFHASRQAIMQHAAEISSVAQDEMSQLIAAGIVSPVIYEEYVLGLNADARAEHDYLVAVAAEESRKSDTASGLEPSAIEENVKTIQVIDPLLAHGFLPFRSRRIGNEYYASRLADMPRAGAAVNAYRAAVLDCVATMTRLLHEAGVLDDPGRVALVTAAENAVDAKYEW